MKYGNENFMLYFTKVMNDLDWELNNIADAKDTPVNQRRYERKADQLDMLQKIKRDFEKEQIKEVFGTES